jgi:small-conductance mechanosensitive channel
MVLVISCRSFRGAQHQIDQNPVKIFDSIFLGNTFDRWHIAIGVTIVTFIAAVVLRRVLLKHIRMFAAKTVTKLDDLLADLLADFKRLPLFLLALYLGSTILDLPLKVTRFIGIALIIAFLLQGGLWGNRVINFLIYNFLQKHGESEGGKKSITAILRLAGRIVLWSIIFLLTLDNLGINISALLAGLGVGGIAIALALQNILGDLFASLSILLDKPFEVGDFIVIGEHLGTVEHIGLKTTRIRSLSGEENIFSNTDLLQSRIRNYKRMSERRVVFSIGVTYQTSAENLARIPAMIREIIVNQSGVRFDRGHFKEYGDSSLNFEVVYYVLSPDYNLYMDVQQKINLEIFKLFEKERIDFAYPTRTLIVENAGH